MNTILNLLAAAVLCASATAAPPVVSNREPKADEWGYRPADGAAARLNPPSFTWIHETASTAYTVEWATKKDFSDAKTATGIVWPTYTHSEPFAPGTYFWRYRFATKSGETSNWSAARSIVVPADAVEFPMPTLAQQKERLPRQHPRLFMRPEDLPRLRELAKGREAKSFAKLTAAADQLIKAGPTPEPEHMGSARNKEDDEAVKYWWPNREQTQKACDEADLMAFVYLITQDPKYGEAARKWVLHLAAWDPDGPTNFGLNCEAGKVMLYRPARAYDWAWDMFTAEDRAKIQAVTKRRIADAWKSGEVQQGTGHLNRPYNSHGNRVWHKICEAAIAFHDEIPEAPMWLDYALNKFYACYPVWSDDDGGWHEGLSYWGGYMAKATWWLQVAKSALDIDGFKKPFFSQVGDFALYLAPPGSPNSGFGDLSFRPPSTSIGGFMEYHLRANSGNMDGHAGYWRWWLEQWHMKSEGGWLGFLYDANLPDLPAAKPPADLPQSKVFHGIGTASLHTTLLDSADDVHLLFKASPFGSQSHGHNPQNTFQLNAHGEALITSCGYRDLHGSKFHYKWVHSTVAQNGVLVNGKGQTAHTAAAAGRIVAEQLTPAFAYVCGDATPAYDGRLTRARRSVVLVKAPVPFIVMYDDLAAPAPASYQFMLHALAPFTIDTPRQALSVAQPRAGVEVRYLPPSPLAFRQWDGFDPAPKKPFPNQWHVEAGTTDQRERLALLTVFVPHRAGYRPQFKAERVDSDTATGIRISFHGGPSRLVAFRRDDKKDGAAWGDERFDGPVLVR